MTNYLLKNRPKISLILISIFFVSNILTLLISKSYNVLLLFPSNYNELWNWYRLITYPFYVGGLITWFLSSIVILLTGYLIENRIKKIDMIGLILISTITGGFVFILLNHGDELNRPLASPIMISWGYWAATIIIGIKYFKLLNLFEKVILILCFLSTISLFRDTFNVMIVEIAVISVIILIGIF